MGAADLPDLTATERCFNFLSRHGLIVHEDRSDSQLTTLPYLRKRDAKAECDAGSRSTHFGLEIGQISRGFTLHAQPTLYLRDPALI